LVIEPALVWWFALVGVVEFVLISTVLRA